MLNTTVTVSLLPRVCRGSRSRPSAPPHSSSSATPTQGSCCARTWRPEGWTSPRWTGSSSTIPPMTPRWQPRPVAAHPPRHNEGVSSGTRSHKECLLSPQEYIHRVGRTARGINGRGHALLILRPEELGFLRFLKQAKVTWLIV